VPFASCRARQPERQLFVHPDGVDAHLERQNTLRRAGWRLMDAFASRWADDPVRAALDIASALRTPVAP